MRDIALVLLIVGVVVVAVWAHIVVFGLAGRYGITPWEVVAVLFVLGAWVGGGSRGGR